jgi:Protein of unknown function (DUF3383)
MAEVSDIISVNVTRQTVFPTRPGFGVGCFLAEHSLWPDRAKLFAGLSDLKTAIIAGGGAITHPIYLAAQEYFGQPLTPTALIIGRRTRGFTQTVTLTPQVTTPGYVYNFDVFANGNHDTPISYTNGNAETTTTIATALAALISAIGTDVASSTGSGPTIATTMAAGKVVNFANLPPVSELKFADTTTDPGLASDFSDLNTAVGLSVNNALSYFGIAVDRAGKAEQLALAAAIEATQMIGVVRSTDSAITDPSSTTDVAYAMQAAAYTKTIGLFAQQQSNDYRDLAWLGNQLPYDIGSTTWAFKTLAGINADRLQPSEASAIEAKDWSTYRRRMGVNCTYEAHTPNGDYIDNVTGSIELASALQLAVFGNLTSAQKIPFTDFGIAAIQANCYAVLNARTAKGAGDLKFLTNSPAPLVTVPKAANVNAGDKAARDLRNITIQAYIAGAIHKVGINVTLSL